MAKGKATTKPSRGQKSISDFFGGGNKKTQAKPKPKPAFTDDDTDVDKSSVGDMTADEDEPEEKDNAGNEDDDYVEEVPASDDDALEADAVDEESADEAMSVEEEEERPKGKSKTKAKSGVKGLGASKGQAATVSSDLPPIHDIRAMFSDLVGNIPEIRGVAEHIQGRKLRVATMCSGTESPLLALEMICNSIQEQHGITVEVEHVFSCEIEPFKQAYIERNFRPPILFRDVCELSEDYATTAYGAEVEVPGDVDMLVAGTSCVDYSNLNTKKQDIDASGESGRTFRGMMSWVTKHRPPIVILENVCSAPWDKVVKYFEEHNYSAISLRVDTKTFYIPHTRTRGYLLAVDQKRSNLPDKWVEWLKLLRRPASSTLDEFLLPSDDPRIHQSREKLVRESFNALDRRTGRTDWTRCESRHQRTRLEEALGSKRPLTNWDEGGFCKLPDFAWNDWGVGQVERVWDLMDIITIRKAKEGVDPCYKTQVWNLSQNVDRNVGEGKEGICPCLTPSMIPYISNRGGPMVGLEALYMQGLPIDKLLLTKETEDQLADLAGNAMSTTVVGACMLSALVVSKKLLKPGDDKETYEFKKTGGGATSRDVMDVDQPAAGAELPIEDHIVGEEHLREQGLNLSATDGHSLADLLAAAQQSIRMCTCEGRTGMTERQINQCADCGYTSCERCGGRPEHNYKPLETKTARLHPSAFARQLKAMLPMSLSIANLEQQVLDAAKQGAGVPMPEKLWPSWCEAVSRAVQDELHFVEPKRQEIWSAIYQSPSATFELSLHPLRPEWRLYAKPEESEPASSKLRKMLDFPVARFLCKEGLFDGVWEIGVPSSLSVGITIEGAGPLVPSLEARLGLQDPEFRDRQVYSRVKVSVPEEDLDKFDRDIRGEYDLLDKCGTASSGLHKQVSDGSSGLPPLFLLLDPARVGPADQDCFVFSISTRRYEYGETRPIVCRLSCAWRQSKVSQDAVEVECDIPTKWVEAEDVAFKSETGRKASFASADVDLSIAANFDACRSANALLVCRVPLGDSAGPEWPKNKWLEVDKINERLTFRSLAWIIERIRSTQDKLKEWHAVDAPAYEADCQRCAPAAPEVRWTKTNKKVIPVEDTVQAGEYERRLKRRPAPFITQMKLDSDGVGVVRIGVNITSLLHRALSRLPKVGRTDPHTLSWRIDTDFVPAAKLNLPRFQLLSNRNDPSHDQPPDFRVHLRPEQLRSLGWMLRQESMDAAPFVEEEIAEATLEPLGWRAEGRARRPVHVRGGVLADEVGYGKTAITLGMIDCTLKTIRSEFNKARDPSGKIRSKATLVVVPPHLTRQWSSEAKKFVGSKLKVVTVESAAKINSLTVETVQEADVLVVASNLFHSSVYLDNLEAFAAGGILPSGDGRYFNARLRSILESLRNQVDLLKEGESRKVMERIREARNIDEETDVLLPTKRLKGKAYRDAAEKLVETAPARAAPGSAASPNPSGLVPEVVLSTRKSGGSSSNASSHVVVSEDDEEPVISKSSKKTKPPASKKRSRQVLSDDEDYADGASSEAVSAASSAAGSSDIDMDVDNSLKTKSKSKGKTSNKKRKSEGGASGPAKKRKLREETDPWKLLTSAVKSDWTQMQAPPLEMFHFARLVVDEYTYLEGKDHALITSLSTDRRWVLSGTPPLADFAALKTIAAFLNLHLGVDDDDESQDKKKRKKKDQTTAEQFHSFREVHSLEWHTHRHQLGQAFLDQFVRQNIAEIDEIDWSQKIEKVDLPAAERAIYLELEHHLRALDMTIKRGRKTESDREKRLAQALGDSQSAEEALLKRCSHFELETSDKENAMKACEVIVQERKKQLEDCKTDLQKHLKEAVAMERKIGRTSEESMFQEYVRVCRSEGVGDAQASETVLELLDEAGVPTPLKAVTNKPHDPRTGSSSKGKSKDDVEKDDLKWTHREQTHVIRRLTKELVGRVRSLRYFTVVRDLQKQREVPPVISCPACGKEGLPPDEIAVLSSCGHTGCYECVKEHAAAEECVAAHSSGCRAAARIINVVKGDTLGVDDEEREGRGKHFGMKLEKVIQLIKKRIPEEERVLIFVQFPDLTRKVAEALESHNVQFLEIKGSASQKSKNLEAFQNGSQERVLLLNVTDESASGANLTGANHAIFLSPLLGPDKDWYTSRETQAIGRIRRYGQEKKVFIWRFLTTNTIDMEIYEQRTGEKVGDI